MGQYSEMEKVEYIPIPRLHCWGISALEKMSIYQYLILAFKKVEITQSSFNLILALS